jgi:5-oxoprolinase (ATP-hydrolysing)
MLANRRRVPPFGLAGGSAGEPGRNWVERSTGGKETFGATFQVDMRSGDVFVVQTPGGGGFGAPQNRIGRSGARKRNAGSA